jgi:hypothetical protein
LVFEKRETEKIVAENQRIKNQINKTDFLSDNGGSLYTIVGKQDVNVNVNVI